MVEWLTKKPEAYEYVTPEGVRVSRGYYEELAEKNLVEKFEAKLTKETGKLMDDAEGLIDDAAGLVDDATEITDDVLLG